MRIFNADGSEAEMCGNGIRCAALHLSTYKTDVITIETLSGRKVIRSAGGNLFEVEMGEPVFHGSGEVAMDVKDRVFSGTRVSMGNPHFVIFVDDVEDFPVGEYGPAAERLFEHGTNVEFVHVAGGTLRQRTWERGVGETLACGTGACAAAAVAIRDAKVKSPVEVALTGGRLTIGWDGEGPIFMTGEAVEVFRGEVHLP
jgi:diaminopimelate epimerase